jgi:ribosomal protein S13
MHINDFRFRVLSHLLKGFVLSDARVRRIYSSNITLKIDLKGYQGVRHILNLPFMANVHVQMLVLVNLLNLI